MFMAVIGGKRDTFDTFGFSRISAKGFFFVKSAFLHFFVDLDLVEAWVKGVSFPPSQYGQ